MSIERFVIPKLPRNKYANNSSGGGTTIITNSGGGGSGDITNYDVFTGATPVSNGKAGLVPAPSSGEQGYYLGGDGRWHNIDASSHFIQTGNNELTLDESLLIMDNLTVNEDTLLKGNTTIGDSSNDNLTVNASSTFEGTSNFKGDITFNKGTGNTLTVTGNTTLNTATVNGNINFNNNAYVNKNIGSKTFVSGQSGWNIDNKGNGELESLVLRSFLSVPELRYNRVTVESGTSWNCVGAGKIKSVDTANHTFNLNLEEGEIGSFDVDDICMGIWHFMDTNKQYNATEQEAEHDDSGLTVAGFAKVYFTITKVENYTENGITYTNGKCTYQTRYEWGIENNEDSSKLARYDLPPMASMAIAGYGNFTNAYRQKSSYSTKTFTRYLVDVNDWDFGFSNIAAQFGDLSGLRDDNGYEFGGYSAYLSNIYMSGTIKELQDGTDKSQLNYRGEYSSTETYKKYDEVFYDGSLWIYNGNDPTTGVAPSTPTWTNIPSGTSITIKSTKVEYAVSPDGINVPSSGWVTTIPTVDKGYYLWSRTIVTYSDGTSTTTYSITYNPKDGVDGTDGTDGTAAVTYYTWIRYADDSNGTGISNSPDGKKYIGFAYNKTTPTESNNPADYKWSYILATDGQAGPKGDDGKTLYTWIKYSDNADGTGMYDTPTSSTLYIGIAVNKDTATESTNKADYTWSKFKGDDGVAGKTLYTWIRYSQYSDGRNMKATPDADTVYIGMAYNKETSTPSNNASDYTWSKFIGKDGVVAGSLYTWIRYADDANGTGISNSPDGKTFIGFAYNKSSAEESNDPNDYMWSSIEGKEGQPGPKGDDGKTKYTWIKYSDNADGTGMYDTPTSSTLYIGIAVNKDTATESSNKGDYTWSKFKGDQGVQGDTLYTWIKYADDVNGNGMSDDPTGKTYIGLAYNKTTKTESTNPADYTWSLIKGSTGATGRGISKIEQEYYLSTSYTARQGGSVVTTAPTWTNGKYIWMRNKYTYTDGTTSYDTWICTTGYHGTNGTNGTNGSNGTSVTKVETFYATSNSNTTAPIDDKFGTSLVSPTSTKPYLWAYTVTTLSSGTTQKSTKVVIGNYAANGAKGDTGDKGDKGDTGDKGDKGDTGRGVKQIVSYFYLKSNSVPDSVFSTASSVKITATNGIISSVVSTGDNTAWSLTAPTPTETASKAFEVIIVIYTDNTISNSAPFVCSQYIKGAKGDQGLRGLTGLIPRMRGVYKTTETYYRTSQYADVVMVANSSSATGYDYYIVKEGISSTSTTPPNSSYWESFSQFKNIATSVLLAQHGYIDVIGAGSLFVGQNNTGVVHDETTGLTTYGINANGWVMNNGEIRHTKTGLKLTSDGKLEIPEGTLSLKVGGKLTPIEEMNVNPNLLYNLDPVYKHLGTLTGNTTISVNGSTISTTVVDSYLYGGASSPYTVGSTNIAAGTKIATAKVVTTTDDNTITAPFSGGKVVQLMVNGASYIPAANTTVWVMGKYQSQYWAQQFGDEANTIASDGWVILKPNTTYTLTAWYALPNKAGRNMFSIIDDYKLRFDLRAYVQNEKRNAVSGQYVLKSNNERMSTVIKEGNKFYPVSATFTTTDTMKYLNASVGFNFTVPDKNATNYPLIYFGGLKLEEGSICTGNPLAQPVNVEGLTKEDLLPTGIDIDHKTITMTANNFTLKNNSGTNVLSADSSGNLAVTGNVTANTLRLRFNDENNNNPNGTVWCSGGTLPALNKGESMNIKFLIDMIQKTRVPITNSIYVPAGCELYDPSNYKVNSYELGLKFYGDAWGFNSNGTTKWYITKAAPTLIFSGHVGLGSNGGTPPKADLTQNVTTNKFTNTADTGFTNAFYNCSYRVHVRNLSTGVYAICDEYILPARDISSTSYIYDDRHEVFDYRFTPISMNTSNGIDTSTLDRIINTSTGGNTTKYPATGAITFSIAGYYKNGVIVRTYKGTTLANTTFRVDIYRK